LLDFARTHYAKNEEYDTTWNARQIRNAFTTAIAMGQFDRLERVRKENLTPGEVIKSGKKSLKTIKLTYRNFDKIADTAADFEKYINSVRGHDTSNALMNQHRDDFFGRKTSLPQKKYRTAREESSYLRERDMTPPSSLRSAKGKMVAKKKIETDSDEDEEEQKPKTTRMSDEEDSDNED
jgi:hypothetical protein